MLKSSLEKLTLVGVITVDPKVQAQELTQSVGEEITRMIANQKNLERRFEELVSAQHVLRTLPNKSKLRDNQVRARACRMHGQKRCAQWGVALMHDSAPRTDSLVCDARAG